MPFDAILFDCDGVLVDSEPISLGILRKMLADLGWHLTYSQCKQLFLGKSMAEELAIIQEHLHHPLDNEWLTAFTLRRNQALKQHVVATPGIYECLKQTLKKWPKKIACVSAAERAKINLQLEKVGLIDFFQGAIFSGTETTHNKPHPDVYIKAAHALQAAPNRCAIIEDSYTGVTAGVAAGATVFGYCPSDADPQALLDAGAHHIFNQMQHLPTLLSGHTS